MIVDDRANALYTAMRAWNTQAANMHQADDSVPDAASYGGGNAALSVVQNSVQASVSLFDVNSAAFTQLRAEAPSDEQAESGEDAKGRLKDAFQHILEEAANDPEFAQNQADTMGKYPELILMSEPFPPNGSSAEEWQRFTARTTSAMNLMLDAHKERQAHYEQLVSDGVSGVELYAQMLEFNASQTDYNTGADGYSGNDTGTRTQHYQDMAAYLSSLMSEEA